MSNTDLDSYFNNDIKYDNQIIHILIDNEMELWFNTIPIMNILKINSENIENIKHYDEINTLISVSQTDLSNEKYINEPQLCELINNCKSQKTSTSINSCKKFESWLALDLIPNFINYSMKKLKNSNDEKISKLRTEIADAKINKTTIGNNMDVMLKDSQQHGGSKNKFNEKLENIKNKYDDAVNYVEYLQEVKAELFDENNYYQSLFKLMLDHRTE